MRADWDSYFMQIATVVASRATCDRKHVGAAIGDGGAERGDAALLRVGFGGERG